MAFSRERILDALVRLPFIDAGELALILGEPLATVHRALSALLKDGLAQRVSHGTAHLPSSHRYYLTKKGISVASDALGYDAPSELVRAYPVSRQSLTLLIRRMDAVASVYRLVATLSPGVYGVESLVEFHRRGRFDAVITLHNGRSFGVARQGLALRRRSLYDRLRAIAEYDYARRPAVVLVPSPWGAAADRRILPQRGTIVSHVVNFSAGGFAVNRHRRFTTGPFNPVHTVPRPPGGTTSTSPICWLKPQT